MEQIPMRIECFDISNLGETHTVASMVVFEGGAPKKSDYRRFAVREAVQDDFAAMQEVVGRYFTRRLESGAPLPDLVLVDGGKGQLSAAAQALERAGVPDLALASLAKREELIFTLDRSDPIRLPRRDPGLRLLQRVRDEAHRFGVAYHRKRRSRRTLRSELLEIPGVGPTRGRALLQKFGSLKALRAANAEEIARVEGIGPGLAETIVEYQRRHGGNGA